MNAIPLLDLREQYASIQQEIQIALDRVISSQHFILGPEVTAFEQEMTAYCGCQFAIGVSSGTDALMVALMAIDLRPGDEVITSPYSFFATAGVIARLGAKPVFADIDSETFNLDPNEIESRITARTRAIMPVHLFGQMADMDSIMAIAGKHGFHVIEDAAQAIGAQLHGKRAGTIGSAGCLSFYPTKNLGCFGEGGMVLTNDSGLADRIRMLRSHGSRDKYHSELLGGNFRLDALQAAVLRVKLKYLERWSESRRRNAALYRELLSAKVQLPAEKYGRHVFNQFVIRHPGRDALINHLRALAIGTEVYYPLPLHLQACFKDLAYNIGDFPASERASLESLALPIYPELTPEMIQHVSAAVMSA